MANRTKKIHIRETKLITFNILKSNSGTTLDGIEFADVVFFGEDPDDSSKILIIVLERTDP